MCGRGAELIYSLWLDLCVPRGEGEQEKAGSRHQLSMVTSSKPVSSSPAATRLHWNTRSHLHSHTLTHMRSDIPLLGKDIVTKKNKKKIKKFPVPTSPGKQLKFILFSHGLIIRCKINWSVLRSQWEEKDQRDLWEIKVIWHFGDYLLKALATFQGSFDRQRKNHFPWS